MVIKIELQDDGTFVAYSPDVENFCIVSYGKDVAEAKESTRIGIEDAIEGYEERNEAVPDFLLEPLEYRYDIPAFFNAFPVFNISSLAVSCGISPSLLRQYKLNQAPISEVQRQRIMRKIKEIADEVSSMAI